MLFSDSIMAVINNKLYLCIKYMNKVFSHLLSVNLINHNYSPF